MIQNGDAGCVQHSPSQEGEEGEDTCVPTGTPASVYHFLSSSLGLGYSCAVLYEYERTGLGEIVQPWPSFCLDSLACRYNLASPQSTFILPVLVLVLYIRLE